MVLGVDLRPVAHNASLGVDQIRVALGDFKNAQHFHQHAVVACRLLGRVGQQSERQGMLRRKCFVRFDIIDADAEDGGTRATVRKNVVAQ